MVFYAVKLLNYFPVKGGVSGVYGPKTIMSGKVIDFTKFSLPFGSYCQVHEEKLPRNTLASRTIGAISLGPSGNTQGGHRFLTLNTGKVVTRRSWDILPMPQSVIDRVNFLGRDQPHLPIFTDRSGDAIGDDDPFYEHSAQTDMDNHPTGEILPDAAPDPVDVTGVDHEDLDPNPSSDTPSDIPGVSDQPINIDDINISGEQEPTLVEPPSGPARSIRRSRQSQSCRRRSRGHRHPDQCCGCPL